MTSAPRDREEHHLPDEISEWCRFHTYDSAQVENANDGSDSASAETGGLFRAKQD